jgi:hypothetical protein
MPGTLQFARPFQPVGGDGPALTLFTKVGSLLSALVPGRKL